MKVTPSLSTKSSSTTAAQVRCGWAVSLRFWIHLLYVSGIAFSSSRILFSFIPLTTVQDIVLKKLSDNHIRVAVVGNVDAGKSTLIGSLMTSTLDDGRGAARSRIIRHKHELVSGRTSSMESYLLALDENADSMGGLAENEAVLRAHCLVSLMDLAGVRTTTPCKN
jgi:ribosome biogenesis GTPase A